MSDCRQTYGYSGSLAINNVCCAPKTRATWTMSMREYREKRPCNCKPPTMTLPSNVAPSDLMRKCC